MSYQVDRLHKDSTIADLIEALEAEQSHCRLHEWAESIGEVTDVQSYTVAGEEVIQVTTSEYIRQEGRRPRRTTEAWDSEDVRAAIDALRDLLNFIEAAWLRDAEDVEGA